jgi:hypothetical protein
MTTPTLVVSCSWCHTSVERAKNSRVAGVHAPTWCQTCRHRADVARVDCDCVRCQLAKAAGGEAQHLSTSPASLAEL